MGSFLRMLFLFALVAGGVFWYLVVTDPGKATRQSTVVRTEQALERRSQINTYSQNRQENIKTQASALIPPQSVQSPSQPKVTEQNQQVCKKRILMYSLTTCPACKWQRNQLQKNKLFFSELYVDKHPSYRKELARKAEKAGLKSYGYPTLEVNGKLLVNPRLSQIYAACSS